MVVVNSKQQELPVHIKSGILSHYTNWSRFEYWLKYKKIFFGDYANWEDKSDVAILKAYENKINKHVRVLCLMDRSGSFRDSFYHWKVYANQGDGIRVDLKKKELLSYLSKYKEIKCQAVEYPNAKELERKVKNCENWPFLKRASYKDDREFRILWVEESKLFKARRLPVEEDFFENCIERITLCPKFPEKFEKMEYILKDKYKIRSVCNSQIFRNIGWEKNFNL
jgi:hypothetical protein